MKSKSIRYSNVKCALETVRRFSLRASHHAYVAFLQYRPRERRFDRVFVESVPRVWHNSTHYWTAWYFPASPGMVIEARLVGGRRDPKSYYRVTAASHWWQASPHLRRISRLQAHRYAIAHAKRLHRSWQRFRHLPAALKVQVWARDRGRCVRCGSTRDLEFDHIIPVAKGGATSAANLQLLCRPCNRTKGQHVVHPDDIPPDQRNRFPRLAEVKP